LRGDLRAVDRRQRRRPRCLCRERIVTSASTRRITLSSICRQAPIAHKRFSVSKSPGLLDWLANTDPIERCTHGCSLPRLRVMPPGRSASPAAAARLRALSRRIRSASLAVGRIIVSIAGAATTAEGLLVADQCDAYVAAVTAGRSRDELASLERQMSRTRARALGAVLMRDDRKGKAHGWRR
jgi:hypothetical protein